MSDIVVKLKSPATIFYEYVVDKGELLHEAADTIEALRAENARLREAVKEAKDAEHQRWVRALVKVLPQDMPVLFREICVAAAMGESDE